MNITDYITMSLSVTAIVVSISVAYLQFNRKTVVYAKLLTSEWQVLSEDEVSLDKSGKPHDHGVMISTAEGGWVPGPPQTLVTIVLDLVFINNGDLPVSIIDVFVNATSLIDQSKELAKPKLPEMNVHVNPVSINHHPSKTVEIGDVSGHGAMWDKESFSLAPGEIKNISIKFSNILILEKYPNEKNIFAEIRFQVLDSKGKTHYTSVPFAKIIGGGVSGEYTPFSLQICN